jgi:hypothetical protein
MENSISLAQLLSEHNVRDLPNSLRWMMAKTHALRLVALESLLDECYRHLADSCHLNRDHSEDALTIQICDMLQMCGINASHDTQIGGHCDVLVRAEDGFLWIGEAKIHSGAAWTYQGFLQLTTRYGRAQYGRDAGEVIIYHRQKNSFKILADWKTYLQKNCADVVIDNERSDLQRLLFRTIHVCQASGLNFHTRHRIIPMYFNPAK